MTVLGDLETSTLAAAAAGARADREQGRGGTADPAGVPGGERIREEVADGRQALRGVLADR